MANEDMRLDGLLPEEEFDADAAYEAWALNQPEKRPEPEHDDFDPPNFET